MQTNAPSPVSITFAAPELPAPRPSLVWRASVGVAKVVAAATVLVLAVGVLMVALAMLGIVACVVLVARVASRAASPEVAVGPVTDPRFGQVQRNLAERVASCRHS